MLISISGTRDGQPWPARGGEIVLPDAEAAEMCANGYAEPVAEPKAPETRTRRVKSSD